MFLLPPNAVLTGLLALAACSLAFSQCQHSSFNHSTGSKLQGLNLDEYMNINSYKTVGNEFRLYDHTQIYTSGKPQSKNGLIIIPDTSGWNVGRIRNLCDFFGEQGLYAVIPNFGSKGIEGQTESFLDSSGIRDWYKSRTFDGNIKPVMKSLISFMTQQGVEKISLLGFGWGSWVAINLLASDMAEEFYCGALSSPSLDLEERMYGGSLPELMSRVNRPLLLMPTQGDPESYKSYIRMLKFKVPTSQIIDYQDVEANFMLRGNSEEPAIHHAIQTSANEILCFYQRHFPYSRENLVREFDDRWPEINIDGLSLKEQEQKEKKEKKEKLYQQEKQYQQDKQDKQDKMDEQRESKEIEEKASEMNKKTDENNKGSINTDPKKPIKYDGVKINHL